MIDTLKIIVYTLVSMVTIVFVILSIFIEKKFRFLCRDAHKPYERYVPCSGGPALYLSLIIGLIVMWFTGMISYEYFVTLTFSLSIGMVIGLIDDLIDLKSRWKIFLGFLPALPILFLEFYTPRPWLPFVGHARLYIIYPSLVAISSTVFINGANMIDTHNGTLSMFTLSVSLFALILKVLTNSSQDVYIALLFVIVLLSYLMFNIYPAKIFNGNMGSHLMGVLLMIITVVLRLEFFVILASIPMFINGFYYISSVKGFIQKERISRPVYVDKNGCMHPSLESHPITLVKLLLILAETSLNEKELVAILYTLYLFTSFLSFVICFLLGYN